MPSTTHPSIPNIGSRAFFCARVHELLELQERMDYKAVAYLGAMYSPRYFRSKWYMLENEKRQIGRELAAMFYSSKSREFRKENADKIRRLVEQGLDNNMDPIEQDFFRLYERMFKYENDYDAGKWVELQFHDGLIGVVPISVRARLKARRAWSSTRVW